MKISIKANNSSGGPYNAINRPDRLAGDPGLILKSELFFLDILVVSNNY